MPATHRTRVLRATLSAAALAANLLAPLAPLAHAGLLGGGGFAGGLGGGLNGTLSPRQIDVAGRTTGNAGASVDGQAEGALLKGGVDKTRGQVGEARRDAAGKAAKAEASGQNLKDESGAKAANGAGSANGAATGAIGAATPGATSTPAAAPAAPATPAGKEAVGGAAATQAAGRNAQASGTAAARASRADRSVTVDASATGAARH